MDLEYIKKLVKQKKRAKKRSFNSHLKKVSQFNTTFEPSDSNKGKIFSATNGKFFRKSPKARILTPTLPEKKIVKQLWKQSHSDMEV